MIDGGAAVRLFAVTSGNSLTLENLTLQNATAAGGTGGAGGGGGGGGAGLGGAVFADGGSFTAQGCTFTNNTAQGGEGGSGGLGGGGGGGGLGSTSLGQNNNGSSGGAGGGVNGGAAGAIGGFGGGGGGGTLGGGSGGFGAGGGGGGKSGGGGKGGFGAGGGGGFSGAGGLGGTFGGNGSQGSNTLGGGGGGAGLGGGIFSNGGALTLIGDTFNANTALSGNGGSGVSTGASGQACGGALFALNGSLNQSSNTFSGNVDQGGISNDAGTSFYLDGTTQATTTTIADNSSGALIYGQSVTFTAAVTDSGLATPTGSVQFFDNGSPLGTGLVLTSSGSVTTFAFTTSTLPANASAQPISAVFTSNFDSILGSSSSPDEFTVSQRDLTITAESSGKTYGQAVTFAGTEFTSNAPDGSSGLVNGDSIASVTLSSPGAAATAHVSGSPYTITASVAVAGTDTDLADYDISYVTGALTVNSRDLTITAESSGKTYGQTVTFAGTEFSSNTPDGSSGLVNGDSIASVTLSSPGAAATRT